MSVIVAVRNAAAAIGHCIESVGSQSHVDVELIVQDGGSTDGTVDILRADSRVDHWESGPDAGIYDAWNKALRRATGEWVCFLGADDAFADPQALTRLLRAGADEPVELVSGRVSVVDHHGSILRVVGEPWNWERMKVHQVIAHPGMLHRRSLFDRFGHFDPRYRYTGDYEFLLRLGPSTRAAFLDEVVVLMGGSGVSRTRVWRLFRESWRTQADHPEIGMFVASRNYVIAIAKYLVRKGLALP